MSDYDNNNSGALFSNRENKSSDRAPDYKGSAEVNGVHFWISSWIKKDRNGKAFMSLAFTAKDEQPAQPAPSPQRQAPANSTRRSPAPESWDDVDAPPF